MLPVEAYIEPITVVVSEASGSLSVNNSFSPIVIVGAEVEVEVVSVPETFRSCTHTVPVATGLLAPVSPLRFITLFGLLPSYTLKLILSEIPAVVSFITAIVVCPILTAFFVDGAILIIKLYFFLEKNT